MNEIKLSFNEEQFKALQKLLYLGNWMLTSMDDHPDKNFKVEEEVEQMIYAHSDTSVSEFSKEFKMFFPPADFEEEMNVLIEDYDQYTFWDELANQLAERDARNELGKQYDKMNYKDKILKQNEYLDFYIQEFMKNDLKNLKIV